MRALSIGVLSNECCVYSIELINRHEHNNMKRKLLDFQFKTSAKVSSSKRKTAMLRRPFSELEDELENFFFGISFVMSPYQITNKIASVNNL